jgi:hypothetical protein
MTETQETLAAVRAQIEAAQAAAQRATNPKEARRLRLVAASLDRALRKFERQQDPS